MGDSGKQGRDVTSFKSPKQPQSQLVPSCHCPGWGERGHPWVLLPCEARPGPVPKATGQRGLEAPWPLGRTCMRLVELMMFTFYELQDFSWGLAPRSSKRRRCLGEVWFGKLPRVTSGRELCPAPLPARSARRDPSQHRRCSQPAPALRHRHLSLPRHAAGCSAAPLPPGLARTSAGINI